MMLLNDPPQLVEIANEKVSIFQAFARIGVSLPDYGMQDSFKMNCPFGEINHNDGGSKNAMKIFPDTNSCYCYAGCGAFTPVRLVAYAEDLNNDEAAQVLLDHIGWVQPTPESRWKAAMEYKEAINTAELAEALKTYCGRLWGEDWDDRQLDDDVSRVLNRCLRLLPGVKDESTATEWLTKTKAAMAQLQQREESTQ